MALEDTTIAGQRLGKCIAAATNTHEVMELLDLVFSMRSASYRVPNM
jgi:hypothetical protein